MKRREFLVKSASGSLALTLPISTLFGCRNRASQSVQFGLCADVHKDIMHDADERLRSFVDAAKNEQSDFIAQLGDFCRPYEYNQSFMDVWNSFPGAKYHVIGNHDMDGGFSRESVLDFWKSQSKYYSFDSKGFHFVVLDGNDVNPAENKASGYARFIGKEQLNWLRQDLKKTQNPVVIFSHQSLENAEGVENTAEVQSVLEEENRVAGFTKVIVCFSGHHHTDYHIQKNGIYYIQINSMSYSWLGGDYKTIRYSETIDKEYPWIKYTVPYKEPLFAFIEIDDKNIKIFGKQSVFVGPSPEDLGVPKSENGPIIPKISSAKLSV